MMGENIPQWIDIVRHGNWKVTYNGKPKKSIVPEDVKFNLDHPYRVGKKSFVVYPYNIDLKTLEPFRIWMEEKRGFKLWLSTDSEYGCGTFKLLMIHEDEPVKENNFDYSEVDNQNYKIKIREMVKKVKEGKNE